jgi:hypothetical protein
VRFGGGLTDDVLVEELVDLGGLGQLVELDLTEPSASSSSMISLQRSMHSSQM